MHNNNVFKHVPRREQIIITITIFKLATMFSTQRQFQLWAIHPILTPARTRYTKLKTSKYHVLVFYLTTLKYWS